MAFETEVNFSYMDYGGEMSSVRVRGLTLTAANFDAQVALAEALENAISGTTEIALGNVIRTSIGHVEPSGLSAPIDPQAQRETKWDVHYHSSSTGKKYRMEIPCADLALLDPNARDRMLVSSGNGQAFVTAFNAYARCPDDGTPAVFDYALHVGRNT